MMFGTSKEQSWNQYGKLNQKEQEMQKLEAVKCENDTENTSDTEKSKFIEDRWNNLQCSLWDNSFLQVSQQKTRQIIF